MQATRRWVWWCWAIAGLVCLGLSNEVWAADVSRPGVCMTQGAKLVGAAPVQIGKQVRLAKKIRNVNPKYPALPAGTTGSGVWRGEFLLDARGTVVEVWAIQEVRLRPAFPAFNQAIVDAIRQWTFEPLMSSGRPVPACTDVTVSINWS